jgi:hypothetical protein
VGVVTVCTMSLLVIAHLNTSFVACEIRCFCPRARWLKVDSRRELSHQHEMRRTCAAIVLA